MEKREQKWLENYERLRAYVMEHRHLPSKRQVENRALLNWWKYNRRLIRIGTLDEKKESLLNEVSELRVVDRLSRLPFHED